MPDTDSPKPRSRGPKNPQAEPAPSQTDATGEVKDEVAKETEEDVQLDTAQQVRSVPPVAEPKSDVAAQPREIKTSHADVFRFSRGIKKRR